MMMQKRAAFTRTIAIFALFSLLLTMGSCKKTVNQVVDQGFSAFYKVHGADFQTSDGGKTYTISLTVPEVNDKIVANGAVMVYLSLDGGVTYEALPEFFENIAYGTYHQAGSVFVDLSAANHTDIINAPADPQVGFYLIKVVILDATPLPN